MGGVYMMYVCVVSGTYCKDSKLIRKQQIMNYRDGD